MIWAYGQGVAGSSSGAQTEQLFAPLVVSDKNSAGQSVNMHIQHVSAKDGFSQDELRLHDYKHTLSEEGRETGKEEGAADAGGGASFPTLHLGPISPSHGLDVSNATG